MIVKPKRDSVIEFLQALRKRVSQLSLEDCDVHAAMDYRGWLQRSERAVIDDHDARAFINGYNLAKAEARMLTPDLGRDLQPEVAGQPRALSGKVIAAMVEAGGDTVSIRERLLHDPSGVSRDFGVPVRVEGATVLFGPNDDPEHFSLKGLRRAVGHYENI